MKPTMIRRLLGLTLALAMAWPGLAMGEATQKPRAAKQQDQETSTQVEVIRRMKKELVDTQFLGSPPAGGGGIKTAQVTSKPKGNTSPGRNAPGRG